MIQIRQLDNVPTYRVEIGDVLVRLQPLEERGRFLAYSDTRFHCPQCHRNFTRKNASECKGCGKAGEPVSYLVDLLENNGRTQCSCENFTCNTRGKRPVHGGVESCKHAAAALALFGAMVASAMVRAEKKARRK